MKHNVTGKIFTRNVEHIEADGRKLIMIVGVLAVPSEMITNEDMYVVWGNAEPALLWASLNLGYDKNVSDISYGNSPDGLLTTPIWQV